MSFKRQNDRLAKRKSRVISVFHGCHYGIGKTDQQNRFAYVSDLQFIHDKPKLRDGCRKNQEVGYTTSITSLFAITIGGLNLAASVENGILSVYPVEDVIAGHRRYYLWKEASAKYTWEEAMDAHTWNSIFTGNR